MSSPKVNDHRRIAWGLSWRIAGSQIVVFIAIDLLIVFLILIARSDPHVAGEAHFVYRNFEAAFMWLRSIRYFDITAFWALVSIVLLQVLLLIGQAIEVRRHVRKLLEPLRELRVAADAISTGVSSETLRRMIEALHNVEAGDMSTHIAAESVSPELRPLLEAIKDMLDRIEAAYAAQTKFVSDASHELRTPIAVIQGYANLLSRWGSEDPDTLHESIEAIRSEADMMKQMVNQLLFLARGDSDTLSLDMQRVDLVPIAAEVIREELMMEEEHKEKVGAEEQKGHEIEACFPEEGGVFVSADPALVKQLIRILVDNSIKYTQPGGYIRLSTAADPENRRALIMVQDEGQGIPEEFLPRIFDRFVRADEARTRNSGGSGLGLSIAKQIAELHGGSIEVFSVEGVGSRFTVILPL